VEAALVMRAAAAYSTTIKNTSDIIRSSLRLKDLADDMDELPELVVTELSQDEIAALRREPGADASLAAEDVAELIDDDYEIVEELSA
jgi:hypothetical protein